MFCYRPGNLNGFNGKEYRGEGSELVCVTVKWTEFFYGYGRGLLTTTRVIIYGGSIVYE